jgi:hypothetical protein
MDRSEYWSKFVGQKLLLEQSDETLEEVLTCFKKTTIVEVKNLAKEIFLDQEIRLITIENN